METGGERKKKAVAAFLVFKSSSLKKAFEKKNFLMGEIYFGCKVMITNAARQKSDKQNNTFNM